MYVGVMDFLSNLTETYGNADTDLPVHEQHLAKLSDALGDSNHTILMLSDGYNKELIKVSKNSSGIQVQRGLENTKPHAFPEGTEVSWVMTPQAVKDIVCSMECCPE